MDSILTSIKKLLGITEEYEHFDQDNHLAVHKRLHVLRCQRTGPLTAPIFRPLFAPQVGNAILGSQSSQRIAAAPALDFPGQPCIMAFAAILERGVL